MDLLASFGYVTVQNESRYWISERAYQLLENPSIDTRIFISYCRKESSAFALLLRARMKSVGLNPFLDINIAPGEEWHPDLERRVRDSSYFVLVVGETTLASENVRREIEWARESETRIIPIWHNGFSYNHALRYPEFGDVLKKNAITVENENAEAYNNAVLKLLNYLGFTLI